MKWCNANKRTRAQDWLRKVQAVGDFKEYTWYPANMRKKVRALGLRQCGLSSSVSESPNGAVWSSTVDVCTFHANPVLFGVGGWRISSVLHASSLCAALPEIRCITPGQALRSAQTEVRKFRVKFTYMWPGEKLKKGLTIPKKWFTRKELTMVCLLIRAARRNTGLGATLRATTCEVEATR